MNFASDNVHGVVPEIMAAITQANQGCVGSYGADALTTGLERRMADLFEHEVAIFPVATGTAANALALAAFVPPWGAVFCHESAHIAVDEANAPELQTGGAKLVQLPGVDGKLTAATLAPLLPGDIGVVHHAQPAAISLTQATECGTVYRPSEIAGIADLAHHHGLAMHMDGARFANAAAFLGVSPAAMTWRAGIDVLSFGATKNGALAAEAVVFFDPKRAADFAFRRKRAGHLFSKMRFLSAQLDAYLTDELWLRCAARANGAAARLARGLAQVDGVSLRHPVEANELFVELPESVVTGLEQRGFIFYRWDAASIRLVTGFDTDESAVDEFIRAVRELVA